LKCRGDQRDLKKIADDCCKATVNCPGLIGTVQQGEFTAQKRSLLPENARLLPNNTRLLPKPLGKSLKFEGTAQNRSLLPNNARLAVGKTDQF
jgi:hypothetical protein